MKGSLLLDQALYFGLPGKDKRSVEALRHIISRDHSGQM